MMCAKPLEPEISNGQLRCPHVTHFSDSDTVNGNEWNLSSSRFFQKNQKTFRRYLKILDCMEKVEECNPDMQIMVMTLNSSNF